MPGPIEYGLGHELVKALRLDEALGWPLTGLAANHLSKMFVINLYAPHRPQPCLEKAPAPPEPEDDDEAGSTPAAGDRSKDFDVSDWLPEIAELEHERHIPPTMATEWAFTPAASSGSCIHVENLTTPSPIGKRGKISISLGPVTLSLDIRFRLTFEVLTPTYFGPRCGEKGSCKDDCFLTVLRTVLEREGSIQITVPTGNREHVGDLAKIYGPTYSSRTQDFGGTMRDVIDIDLRGEETVEVATRFLIDPRSIRRVPPDVEQLDQCQIPARRTPAQNPQGVTGVLQNGSDDCHVECFATFAGEVPNALKGYLLVALKAEYVGPSGSTSNVEGGIRLGIWEGRIVVPEPPPPYLLQLTKVIDGCAGDSYDVSLTVELFFRWEFGNQRYEQIARRRVHYRHVCDRINSEMLVFRARRYIFEMRLNFKAMCDPLR
ncbi:MAG: hypothetical protein WAL47_02740 [Pyrinomonadaceae bacterium]